jgi:hypothetical protein
MQNDMNQDTAIIRQSEIRMLPALCQALVTALERRGLGPERALAAWREDVAAICPQCGISVSGAELFALAHPPAAETSSAKTGRLRLGYCARSGCESYYCQLTFKMHGEFDWMDILAQAEGILRDVEHPDGRNGAQRQGISHRVRLLWRSGRARRVCIALATVLLLMLGRHWYSGRHTPPLQVDSRMKAAWGGGRAPSAVSAAPVDSRVAATRRGGPSGLRKPGSMIHGHVYVDSAPPRTGSPASVIPGAACGCTIRCE